MERHYLLAAGGSQGESLVLLDVRRRRLGVVTFLKASYLESRRWWWWRSWPVVLLDARWSVLQLGCWKTCAVVLAAVVTSVTAGWRRCSLRGGCYVSPWQRE
jgi:hypothetical protein